jgi:hypothetical protein
MTEDDVCGSEPPRLITDAQGQVWRTGDCWCTLAPDHDGDCVCETCQDRHGAPGWPNPAQRYEAALKTPPSAEACAVIRQRLQDGTAPRRTVRPREAGEGGDESL